MAINQLSEFINNEIASRNFCENNVFKLLQHLNELINISPRIGQESLIRLLEIKKELPKEIIPILNSLLRAVGLYPYLMNDFGELSFKEKLSYMLNIAPEEVGENIVFHREQTKIFNLLIQSKSIILSAPTSFGKSLIIDAVISSNIYKKFVIIVPTIALIDETRRRLTSKFSKNYEIVTHTNYFSTTSDKVLYILTQERFMSSEIKDVDFFVIDEFYKLNNLDQRGNLLNLSFDKLLKKTHHFYLLGPNVKDISEKILDGLKRKSVDFEYFDIHYPTVATNFFDYSKSHDKKGSLIKICKNFIKNREQTLIYCQSPKEVQKIAGLIADNTEATDDNSQDSKIRNLCDWLSNNYNPEWSLINMLKKGIGIHHANLPRAISQYLVYLFNNGLLNFLICTSTIIEGVNTSARNIVIWNKKIGNDDYDLFTFNNISGRAGRMFEHFVGNVFLFNKVPDGENLQLDFPLFNQEIADENLLFDLDFESLTEKSKKSIKSIDLGKLDKKVIKLIQIDKLKAVEFANSLSPDIITKLNKLTDPYRLNFNDLKYLCEIIWKDLIENPIRLASSSVKTFPQLAFFISQLNNPSYEPDDFNPTADKKILNYIAFQKNWAGHHLPTAIRSLETIINHVYPENRINLERLSNTIENFYYHPFIVTLDEYGLPMQIGDKYKDIIIVEDNFKETLQNIKFFDTRQLYDFEKDAIEFIKKGL